MMSSGETSGSGSDGAKMPSRSAETVTSGGSPGICSTCSGMIASVVTGAAVGAAVVAGAEVLVAVATVAPGAGSAVASGAAATSLDDVSEHPNATHARPAATAVGITARAARRDGSHLSRNGCRCCEAIMRRYPYAPQRGIHQPMHRPSGRCHSAHDAAGSSTRCRAFEQRAVRSSWAMTIAEHGRSPVVMSTRSWVMSGSSSR